MDLTVAVVCSSDPLLDRCLASIDEAVSVLLVLNYPTSRVEEIAATHPSARIIRHDERNLGLLRQIAADAASTSRICFIDSDCEFTPGTLRAIDAALGRFAAVSVPMRYRHTGPLTRVVSRCRKFTTPDAALLIPAAFILDVQSLIGGHLYDRGLVWGEDSDPAKRLAAAGVPIGISEGRVWHRALGLRADAASARRLGRGRRIRERVLGDVARSAWRDLRGAGEVRLARTCCRQEGMAAAFYHLLMWRPSYKAGYWWERMRHG